MKKRWSLICLVLAVMSTVFAETKSKGVTSDVVASKSMRVDLGSGVTMELVFIAAGSFQMGSNSGDSDEKPVHRVTLSKSFWMAKTEVTQAQYEQIMGNNPSKFKGSQNPVERVSWNDAMEFCKKLTKREQQAGRLPEGFEYTLPTEAQWEYACRAGTTGKYAGDLNAMAWYDSNSRRKTHPVGTKRANAWGLYDMHGNVWEWCLDHCDWKSGVMTDTYREGVVDPVCRSGSDRVGRGGGWVGGASHCRSAHRFTYGSSFMGDRIYECTSIGFIVMSHHGSVLERMIRFSKAFFSFPARVIPFG